VLNRGKLIHDTTRRVSVPRSASVISTRTHERMTGDLARALHY